LAEVLIVTEHLGLAFLADLIVKALKKLFQFAHLFRGGLSETPHIEHVEEVVELEEHTVTTRRTVLRVYRNSVQPNRPPPDATKH
jgi:hypothetical protein